MREYANERIDECRETAGLERSERIHTLVCDYAQNGELPSFGSEQPGDVYYYSPLSIFIFGIVNTDQKDDMLTTYCYDEGVGKKGGNNVASLLVKHLSRTVGLDSNDPMKELNIIMDNCAGQNKNKMVLRLAAYLVELNYFTTVNFVFYVVGHTKNPADRLFNLAKSNIRQQNVYTMELFLKYMNDSEYVKAIECFESDFLDWNTYLDNLYVKDFNTPQVKKWQIFSVEKPAEGEPLSMTFKASNLPEAETMNYLVGKATANRRELFLVPHNQLPPPGRAPIKQVELYSKFRKFVPEIYQDDCCPKPSDAILNKHKIERCEKVKTHQEKKKKEEKQRVEDMAKRALGFASAKKPAQNTTTEQLVDNDERPNHNKRKKKRGV